MGSRANIKCVDQGKEIYFYTHWDGDNIIQTLQAAVERGKGRWSGPPYMQRIIFSEMIQNNVLSETGYGISTYECDNQYDIPTVDFDRKVIEYQGINYTFGDFLTTVFDGSEDAEDAE